MSCQETVLCRNPDPAKASVRLPAWKFDIIRQAILQELAAGPVPLSELTERIRPRIATNDMERLGKLGWHMMGVKLELEVRGEIRRLPGVPQRLALSERWRMRGDGAVAHFDTLETRSADQREAEQLAVLNDQLARAGHTAVTLGALADLARLPVLRKSDLTDRQKAAPPFGGLSVTNAAHVFQSPGPIYEPGGVSHDWWRMGRFLHALGIGPGDTVQNCFSYHFVPAGMIFESGARAVGARVFPAGTGQTELQVRAAVDIGCTAYAGTPDYLKIILERADEMGERLAITRAAVGGGALFPSLRAHYRERGIDCRQCYATADLGNIAYETADAEGNLCDGMVIDEGVIVEIVRPGTGDPVPTGEVGEVVVTTLNPDYPLIRFATGDMSAILPGDSPCGRTNARIRGWLGRADQTTKIKGMFVRPEQVAAFVARHEEVARARVVASREGDMDVMTVQIETRAANPKLYEGTLLDTLKLRGKVELVPPGSLPNDGKVIEDRRSYD